MCGIAGIISKTNSTFLEKANKLISHRGPDDWGDYIDMPVMLTHRRLSILDISSNGHQPMLTQDENLVLIFNGEIYNHTEIRNLLKNDYPFKSTSDTETILYAFKEFGVDLFAMLNGIFALAIYDKINQELIIARDQFGIKPLYFQCTNDEFAFSSELKALLANNNFNSEINIEAISNYLSFLWCPGTLTPFKNVQKLDAGCYINIPINNPSNFAITKFYDIVFNGQYSTKTEKELINELDELLLQAVKRQLQSDVPVGFFLSGGLDSSAMVAMAKKIDPQKKWVCYTIETSKNDSENEGFADDLYYAKMVAKHLNLDLRVVKVTPDIINEFDKMIWHLDEPQADPAPLNVLNICKQARADGYKVLLGGTAGDDLFSGYRRHLALRYEGLFAFLQGKIGRVIHWIIEKLPAANAVLRRLKKLTANVHLSKKERMFGYFEWISHDQIKNLLSANFKKQLADFAPGTYFYDLLYNISNEKSDLNKMLYWELKTFLPAHNLNYTDKLSMATGVEVRVPFLDLDLVKFSTKIPPELKMKGIHTKYLLKKVMERYLPKEVIYRPKTGFGAPIRTWIKKDLKPIINERLSEKRINEFGLFNSKAVQQLIQDDYSGKIDGSYTILSLLAIESWIRQFAKK